MKAAEGEIKYWSFIQEKNGTSSWGSNEKCKFFFKGVWLILVKFWSSVNRWTQIIKLWSVGLIWGNIGYVFARIFHNQTGWCSGNRLRLTFGRNCVHISAGTPAMLTEVFRTCPQSLQDTAASFQIFSNSLFINHHTNRRYINYTVTASLNRQQTFTYSVGSVFPNTFRWLTADTKHMTLHFHKKKNLKMLKFHLLGYNAV
jgi:hypothetical protein